MGLDLLLYTFSGKQYVGTVEEWKSFLINILYESFCSHMGLTGNTTEWIASADFFEYCNETLRCELTPATPDEMDRFDRLTTQITY